MNPLICPCGNQKPYNTCCQPYLSGSSTPSTPEQLMRSRYTAFGLGDVDYLVATQHPSTCTTDIRDAVLDTIQHTQWFSLRVLKSEIKHGSPQRGFVNFMAFCHDRRTAIGLLGSAGTEQQLRLPHQLNERSEFIYEQKQWFYLHGTPLPLVKFKRNDSCWCGSEKKFKQCHGTGRQP